MRLYSLDGQVPAVAQPNGKPYQWSGFQPPSSDPTRGIRLWARGEDFGGIWTPGDVMPTYLNKALRFCPPADIRTGRPRSQMFLNKTQLADVGTSAEGEPVTGLLGTERWWKGYAIFPPDFDIPKVGQAFQRPATVIGAWHGEYATGIGRPNVQFMVRRAPDNDGPMFLTVNVAGGRYAPSQTPRLDGSGNPVLNANGKIIYDDLPEPAWAYDTRTVYPTADAAVQYFIEIEREFLLHPVPIEDVRGVRALKLVTHMLHDWRTGVAVTEIWCDGVKRVGPGSGASQIFPWDRKPGASAPLPDDWEDLSNIYHDEVHNTTQQSRLQVCIYMPNEGPASSSDPEVWNRSVWWTGQGFYDSEVDVLPTDLSELPDGSVHPPEAKVRVVAPGERWDVLGRAVEQRLRGPTLSERWSVTGTGATVYELDGYELVERVDGDWRVLA